MAGRVNVATGSGDLTEEPAPELLAMAGEAIDPMTSFTGVPLLSPFFWLFLQSGQIQSLGMVIESEIARHPLWKMHGQLLQVAAPTGEVNFLHAPHVLLILGPRYEMDAG